MQPGRRWHCRVRVFLIDIGAVGIGSHGLSRNEEDEREDDQGEDDAEHEEVGHCRRRHQVEGGVLRQLARQDQAHGHGHPSHARPSRSPMTLATSTG